MASSVAWLTYEALTLDKTMRIGALNIMLVLAYFANLSAQARCDGEWWGPEEPADVL